MTIVIHHFKVTYPSGYVKKGLTVADCQRIMKKRKDVTFELDKKVVLTVLVKPSKTF